MSVLPPLDLNRECAHAAARTIGLGMRMCMDCTTFWHDITIGIIPAPDCPPSDDACICCGATDDLVRSQVVPLSLWDRERIPARLAGMPSIRQVTRCRMCDAHIATTRDHLCPEHGGSIVEFEH